MVGVADEVVEGLFDLDGVEVEIGEVVGEDEIDGDLAGSDFGLEREEGFVEEIVEVGGFATRLGGAHRLEELFQNEIEAFDFGLGGIEVGGEGILVVLVEIFEFALEEL